MSNGEAMIATLDDLRVALEQSWDKDTAYPKARAEAEKGSSVAQCWATALVVQDYFGGEILMYHYGNGDKHFWNCLPDGTEVDLTADQFIGGVVPYPPLETMGVPSRGWNPRYRKLSVRVRERLSAGMGDLI